MDQTLTPHEDVWLISCEYLSVLFSLMTTMALFWGSIRVADDKDPSLYDFKYAKLYT